MKDLNFKENSEKKNNELKKEKEEENVCIRCKWDKDSNFLNKKKSRESDENELEECYNENTVKKLNTDPNSNKLEINFGFDLIKDSYSNDTGLDNIFIVFKSINDVLYIIYANNIHSIILFNFIDN